MTLKLKSDDIEIENLTPGPILHIFPDKDPYDAAEDILKGLYLLDNIEEIICQWDDAIKQKEQPAYLLMAFSELKRVLRDIEKKSEKQSLEIMEKVKKI